jgi:hypothetical protein
MNSYYTDLEKIIQPLSALTTVVQNASSSWEESTFVQNNFLTLSGGIVTGNLTITGNVSAINLRTSFNTGSAGADYSFAEGSSTTASGVASHAEGSSTTASGVASHAEGSSTTASGQYSHAEGQNTSASGQYSHAEGRFSNASGEYSHAEGVGTIASGTTSHAEGSYSFALGDVSHAAGVRASTGNYCYVWTDSQLGTNSINVSSTKTGQYMVSASGGVFIPGKFGIGTDSVANALTVAGNISAAGAGLFNGATIFGDATITGNASISSATFGNNTNSNGVIVFSNSSYGDEIGFIGDDDMVLAIRRSIGGGKIYEYGGGNPGNANLSLSANNTESCFNINSLLVVLPNLPTSSTGLPTGALWNDAGTVKIKL